MQGASLYSIQLRKDVPEGGWISEMEGLEGNLIFFKGGPVYLFK
jgi:hypothetical protein